MRGDRQALNRRFRIIAFDWDGTAVDGRGEDATPVRRPIERLLGSGVPVVVITGTNLGNIDRQFAAHVSRHGKQNLYLATNRGSEVYGFDRESRSVALWRRIATPEEERLLTEIADSVRDRVVARTGLDVRVIYDRLNRRKIDLIPVEKWRDPSKAATGDLLLAVEGRLADAGLEGGLGKVFQWVQQAAVEKGLRNARVTSDVKHVEIGLTDKADSVLWLLGNLVDPRGIPRADILIGGDEFGPVAGFPGSDSRMMVPEASGAVFASVGPEPGGVPYPVIHLGGGPARFRELIAAQAAMHPVRLPAVATEDPDWIIVEQGFDLAREHEVESLFAVGNGFVGTRGSIAEGSPLSAPATFVAGVYEPSPGGIPALVRMGDWTELKARVNTHPLSVMTGENLEHRRVLDLRQGILWRTWRHRDETGRITGVHGLRLVSLADRHLLLQSATVVPENYSGTISVEAVFSRAMIVKTSGGTIVACAVAGRVETPEGHRTSPVSPGCSEDVPERWELDLEIGKTYRLDRVLALYTSREVAEPEHAARNRLDGVDDLAALVEAHERAWKARWETSDVELEGDSEAQRALRFAIYHLVSAANPEDERVSIGARALTGSAYGGHVFWDTDTYMLPFFALTDPKTARALLMYRYHTLPAARARAAELGFRGAQYAWESADTGDDVTPRVVLAPDGEVIRIRAGEEEHHISADVAYAVWMYWRAAGDDEFLLHAGAEIIVETARFWASRVERGAEGRYHIRRIVGPDEYHESVDDDAYTNGMAQWNLESALEVASLLGRLRPDGWSELCRRVRLDADELLQWSRVAADIDTRFDARTGLIEQFRGYFDLEEIDPIPFEQRTAPVDVLMGRHRIQRSQIIKQPDVIMLIHLLWDRFPPEAREANFRYYERRTGHGSSLSPPIHALVAARLGHTELALKYFRQTAEIDLADNMGNASGGVHVGALGGLWQAAIFGFAGLRLGPSGPEVQPRLPTHWRRLRFAVHWHGSRFAFDLPGHPSVPNPLGVGGHR
jgi:trehalose/maltose hydrolase-like predicted phosphorylase